MKQAKQEYQRPFLTRLKYAVEAFRAVMRDEPAGIVLLDDCEIPHGQLLGSVCIAPMSEEGTFRTTMPDPTDRIRWYKVPGAGRGIST